MSLTEDTQRLLVKLMWHCGILVNDSEQHTELPKHDVTNGSLTLFSSKTFKLSHQEQLSVSRREVLHFLGSEAIYLNVTLNSISNAARKICQFITITNAVIILAINLERQLHVLLLYLWTHSHFFFSRYTAWILFAKAKNILAFPVLKRRDLAFPLHLAYIKYLKGLALES